MKRSLSLAALALVLGGCELMQPREDPVLIKLTELERRLENIERVVQNQSLVNMTQQVGALERRGDELQGRVEELEHGSESMAERQRQLYVDIDTRMQELETSMRAQYELTKRFLIGFQDKEAGSTFRAILKRSKDSSSYLVQRWMHYVGQEYLSSLWSFQDVVTGWRDTIRYK